MLAILIHSKQPTVVQRSSTVASVSIYNVWYGITAPVTVTYRCTTPDTYEKKGKAARAPPERRRGAHLPVKAVVR